MIFSDSRLDKPNSTPSPLPGTNVTALLSKNVKTVDTSSVKILY